MFNRCIDNSSSPKHQRSICSVTTTDSTCRSISWRWFKSWRWTKVREAIGSGQSSISWIVPRGQPSKNQWSGKAVRPLLYDNRKSYTCHGIQEEICIMIPHDLKKKDNWHENQFAPIFVPITSLIFFSMPGDRRWKVHLYSKISSPQAMGWTRINSRTQDLPDESRCFPFLVGFGGID